MSNAILRAEDMPPIITAAIELVRVLDDPEPLLGERTDRQRDLKDAVHYAFDHAIEEPIDEMPEFVGLGGAA